MKAATAILGLAVLLSSGFASAQKAPGTAIPMLQQRPAKPHRVVDLKSGSFVIDAPGDWVLNRSWSFEYRGEIPLNVIDVAADNVVLDFRGFRVEVHRTSDIARVTLINVQGRAFTLKNAVVSIGDGQQSSALRSTGDATTIDGLSGFSLDTIDLQGHSAVIRNSAFHVRNGVNLSSTGTIENTFIGCNSTCMNFAGDQNKLLNSRIRPGQFVGLRVRGDGNLLAGNVIDFPAMGPELQIGFDVQGDANVLRNNTLATDGETYVVLKVSGTGNILDGNVGAVVGPQGAIATGIRFEQIGNFYGDNRMDTAIPFDLGGTTQTDWGGNVGY